MPIQPTSLHNARGLFAAFLVFGLQLGMACTGEQPPPTEPQTPSSDDSTTSPGEDTGQGRDTAPPADTGEVEERTPEEELFYTTCAQCHGNDGDSGSAPNLSQIIPRISDERLAEVILEGTSVMPGDQVPEESVPILIAYLRERYP